MKSLLLFFVIAMTLPAAGHAAVDISHAFAGVTLQTPACFVRTYNSRYLAHHPRQTVRRIKIKLRKASFAKGDDPTPTLAIQVLRKNEKKTWTNNITCMDYDSRVLCAVECDGGSVEILDRKVVPGDTLVVKNNGVVLYGGCDSDDPTTIYLAGKPGGDDLFTVPAAPVEACADVSDEFH